MALQVLFSSQQHDQNLIITGNIMYFSIGVPQGHRGSDNLRRHGIPFDGILSTRHYRQISRCSTSVMVISGQESGELCSHSLLPWDAGAVSPGFLSDRYFQSIKRLPVPEYRTRLE